MVSGERGERWTYPTRGTLTTSTGGRGATGLDSTALIEGILIPLRRQLPTAR